MPVSPLILEQLALLRDLPPEHLAELGKQMEVRELARREVLFQKNDAAKALHFLIEGRLQAVDFTVDGREVGLYFVDSGDFFGELAVIDGKTQPEFMIALTKSRVASMPKPEARTLILTTPGAAEQVLGRLAQRLRAAAAQRILLALPNPAQRVCAQLVRLTIRRGDASVIAHAPTHQELAIMINTSRETVTRVFQVLQANGVLKRDGDQLAVADPGYLESVAEGKTDPPKAG